jgi:hypothetical protein
MAVDFGLAGFPRIPFDPQTSNNDVQLWLTPAVLGVSAPWLFFKAYQEQRISWLDFDPNEDRTSTTQEKVIFMYKNLGFFLNFGCGVSMVWQVQRCIQLFCVSLCSRVLDFV